MGPEGHIFLPTGHSKHYTLKGRARKRCPESTLSEAGRKAGERGWAAGLRHIEYPFLSKSHWEQAVKFSPELYSCTHTKGCSKPCKSVRMKKGV